MLIFDCALLAKSVQGRGEPGEFDAMKTFITQRRAVIVIKWNLNDWKPSQSSRLTSETRNLRGAAAGSSRRAAEPTKCHELFPGPLHDAKTIIYCLDAWQSQQPSSVRLSRLVTGQGVSQAQTARRAPGQHIPQSTARLASLVTSHALSSTCAVPQIVEGRRVSHRPIQAPI